MKYYLFKISSPVRMKRLILLIIVFVFLISGCDTTDPKPPEEKPPGYQEDIPWPSLADSPWPMFRADPQNTGRSRYSITNKSFAISNSINTSHLLAGISLGNNSIYFNSSNPSTLYSYNQNTSIKNWEMLIGMETITAPIITDQNIFTTAQNVLYTLNHNGDTLWTYKVEGKYISQRSLNIDRNGNIYIVHNQTLFKLSQEGNIINQEMNAVISHSVLTTAFSPDGSTLYLRGNNASVIAIDANSFAINWTFGNISKALPPSVDSYGNIYVLTFSDEGNSNLFSINSAGSLNWQFTFQDKLYYISPTQAIGRGGNIYFGSDTLYSVAFNGKLNWKMQIASNNQSLMGSGISEITTDAEDKIIIGTFDNRVILISKEGITENEVVIPNGRGFLPIIIANDVIYAPLYKGEGETGDIFILK